MNLAVSAMGWQSAIATGYRYAKIVRMNTFALAMASSAYPVTGAGKCPIQEWP